MPGEVGYGKPPEATRFRKGRSGNPKGRPRGSRNFVTLLEEALAEPVVISQNGRRRKASKMEAIAKQLVNKAAQGDHRSIQLLMTFAERQQLLGKDEEASSHGDDVQQSSDGLANFDLGATFARAARVLFERDPSLLDYVMSLNAKDGESATQLDNVEEGITTDTNTASTAMEISLKN